MENRIKCSQCRYLKKGEGKESFVNPQGVHTIRLYGRYNCEADCSYHFTDEQITELKKCKHFRLKTLTFWQEFIQKVGLFLKKNFPTILSVIKWGNI